MSVFKRNKIYEDLADEVQEMEACVFSPKEYENWPLKSNGSRKWAASSLGGDHFDKVTLNDHEKGLFTRYLQSLGDLQLEEFSFGRSLAQMWIDIDKRSDVLLHSYIGMLHYTGTVQDTTKPTIWSGLYTLLHATSLSQSLF